MTLEEMKQKFQDWKFAASAYQMAITIISIDKLTVAPPAGAAYRDAREAYLSGELFSMETDPAIAELFRNLLASDGLTDTESREIELYQKEMNHILSIPKEEYVSFRALQNKAYDVWHQAKLNSSYAEFEPVLKEMIAAKKSLYSYRSSTESVYNQMLDDFEPGMNMEKYDAFFSQVKERLVPLIQKVAASRQPDTSFLHLHYPADIQKKFTEEVLLPYLGFTHDWGYQNETEHPFTDFTCENDCRTTTKYLEDNVVSSIFSTIHETGHAWYMHDVDPAYDGSILSFGISSAMHESQSRFCENYLGRSTSFWEALYPKLQEYFPEQLGNVTLDAFMKAVNASEPSLVRTEADELTYPLHILVRYEIEKYLFAENGSVDHLDELWNAKMKEYLGVDVLNDQEGILQDVHWSSGDFGYFPTYALGSAFGAQFFAAMKKDLDVDECLRSGNYRTCMNWLKTHIHQYGCRYDAPEIMKMATGEEFHPEYYLDYLEEKYSKLYELD